MKHKILELMIYLIILTIIMIINAKVVFCEPFYVEIHDLFNFLVKVSKTESFHKELIALCKSANLDYNLVLGRKDLALNFIKSKTFSGAKVPIDDFYPITLEYLEFCRNYLEIKAKNPIFYYWSYVHYSFCLLNYMYNIEQKKLNIKMPPINENYPFYHDKSFWSTACKIIERLPDKILPTNIKIIINTYNGISALGIGFNFVFDENFYFEIYYRMNNGICLCFFKYKFQKNIRK